MYDEEEAKRKPGAVLKDLNWIDRHMDLQLGPQKRGYFVEQVTRDVEVSKFSNLLLNADMVVDAAAIGNNGLQLANWFTRRTQRQQGQCSRQHIDGVSGMYWLRIDRKTDIYSLIRKK